MAKNQVTLTFAGDGTKLSETFDQVGQSARKMEGEVGSASRSTASATEESFSRVGSAAEGTDDKFGALEATGLGTLDVMSGVGEIMQGNVLQGATDLAGGVSSLAQGFSGFLLPGIKAVANGFLGQAIQTGRATAAATAQRAAALATAAATGVMTAAQRGLNLVMRANPIGLIITALVALTAGVIWAYKNVGWFRSAVDTAMRGARNAFNWAIEGGKKLVSWVAGLPGSIKGWLDAVPRAGAAMLSWFQGIPGKIGGYFRGLASTISAPYRAAFNGIREAWNNTVGGKGFSVPGWVPGMGGKDFRIPYFHTGGIVPGGLGSESLAVLRAGERVTAGTGAGVGGPLVIRSDGSQLGALLVEVLRQAIRKQGGNVQVVLGGR